MAIYTPGRTWAPGVAGGTLIRALDLNHIEQGIVGVSQDVTAVNLRVDDSVSAVSDLSTQIAQLRDSISKGGVSGSGGIVGLTTDDSTGVISADPSANGGGGGGGNGTITQVNGYAGPVVLLTKADIGLGNVNNTSDANKPIPTAVQNAIDSKAPLNSPTFTGNVTGINKSSVALGNVDNTSDANKPVSTLQQSALNLKANLNSPTFTGTVGGITKAMVGLANAENTNDSQKFINFGVYPEYYYTGTAWPSRTLPINYSGPVKWNSELYANVANPPAIDGDRWARKRTTT